jgi:excisionase family DNA binding protein
MKRTYNLKEAAEIVGYSTRTLLRAIDRGDLKAASAKGGAWRVSRFELAHWWRERGGGELFGDDEDAVEKGTTEQE